MSGRISCIAGVREPTGKITLFVAAASGGVWKSDDSGTRYGRFLTNSVCNRSAQSRLIPRIPKTCGLALVNRGRATACPLTSCNGRKIRLTRAIVYRPRLANRATTRRYCANPCAVSWINRNSCNAFRFSRPDATRFRRQSGGLVDSVANGHAVARPRFTSANPHVFGILGSSAIAPIGLHTLFVKTGR